MCSLKHSAAFHQQLWTLLELTSLQPQVIFRPHRDVEMFKKKKKKSLGALKGGLKMN